MKLLFYLLGTLLLPVALYAQCGTCFEPMVLINGNFSNFVGPLSSATYPCASPIYPGYMGASTYFYFSHSNMQNWYRIKGAPSGGVNDIGLRTVDAPGGGGHWCATTGGQKVASSYPFLKNGEYSIEVNFSFWDNNCGGAIIAVSMENGLTEPSVPADVVEGGAPIPNVGSWSPTPYGISWYGSSISFCAAAAENFDQLSIEAFQPIPELFPPGHTYAGEPAGFVAALSSVNVKLCNRCPDEVFVVTSPASPDPVTATPFSAGGLFIDAGIDVHGAPFGNNPDEKTLMLARWTEIGRTKTVGESFFGQVNDGSFFEIVADELCGDIHPCKEIVGPTSWSCTDPYVIHFESGSGGGVWTSSDPTILSVSSTGDVTRHIWNVATTVTLTYKIGNCILTKDVALTRCVGKPGQASIIKDEINIFPNPTQSIITIFYPCKQSGQLEINIKDVSGRIVYAGNVTCKEGGSIQQIVDMQDNTSGVYFVELTLNGERIVKKIVKL